MFCIVMTRATMDEPILSKEEKSTTVVEIAKAPMWEVVDLQNADDGDSLISLSAEEHLNETLKTGNIESFSNVPNHIVEEIRPQTKYFFSSVALLFRLHAMSSTHKLTRGDQRRQSNVHSNSSESGLSEQMPLIAGSEAELVNILQEWTQEHHGRLLPGTAHGTIRYVEAYVPKKLILTGTSELILIKRVLVNSITTALILKAADGSCMLTKPNRGNNQQWCGHNGWLGGERGYTNEIVASTDGKSTRPTKVGTSCVFNGVDQKTLTSEAPLMEEQVEIPDNLPNFNKPRLESHRYPTRERRLASISNGFEPLEGRGNTGDQTPPVSTFDKGSNYLGIPQHPDTPKANLRPQQSPHTLRRRLYLRNQRPRSPSIELISVNPASPLHRGRGRPRGPKSSAEKKVSRFTSDAEKPSNSPRRGRGRPKGSKTNKDNKTSGFQLGTSALLARRTPSRRTSKAKIVSSPTVSVSTRRLYQTPAAEFPRANNVTFHFFLSDGSFGAIPKLFPQCATPDAFFQEARFAWHFLDDESDKGARLLGVKVVIEGVARPIVLLWGSEDGYERMVEAVRSQIARTDGGLNVEVRCIRMG